MSRDLFPEGGPHNFQQTSPGMFEASIKLEPDAHGMLARACPNESCAPGYFKVKPGTGLSSPTATYCPYCERSAAPKAFPSEAQLEYGKAVVLEEAKQGIANMLREALNLDSSGRRSFGSGLVTMKMELKAAPRQAVVQPAEEELRRELTCPHCGLVHAVFGLASVCPDCGRNILTAHVREELAVVQKILNAIPGRLDSMGARVAARDVENALEDVVSIFEAVMKYTTQKVLLARGQTAAEVDQILRSRVRNEYQSVSKASNLFKTLLGGELLGCLDSSEIETLSQTFEKRHPITHNLGIVDRMYMRKAAKGELEGREVRVTAEEVGEAIRIIERVIEAACQGLLGNAAVPASQAIGPQAEEQPAPAEPFADELGRLSPAARSIAEYLVTKSELGQDRDPMIALGDLEPLINIPKSDLLAAAQELRNIECLWLHDPIPNSRDEVAPLPKLFELCDAVWMGWNVAEDAAALARAAVGQDALIVPQAASERGWSPRRMNPALEYLLSRALIEEAPSAHPYVICRIQENQYTAEFASRAGKTE